MLCVCTKAPAAMSAAAKPIVTLYLTMGSLFLMARAAILWPDGTWLRQVRPFPSLAPISTFEREMMTLSAWCRRIVGPAAGLSKTSIMLILCNRRCRNRLHRRCGSLPQPIADRVVGLNFPLFFLLQRRIDSDPASALNAQLFPY